MAEFFYQIFLFLFHTTGHFFFLIVLINVLILLELIVRCLNATKSYLRRTV